MGAIGGVNGIVAKKEGVRWKGNIHETVMITTFEDGIKSSFV